MTQSDALYLHNKKRKAIRRDQEPMAFKNKQLNMRKKTLPCEARMAILLLAN
jgi:hypothetical protein